MREWDVWVRDRLDPLLHDSATVSRVAEDLAEMLRASEAEAVDSGETAEDAVLLAEAQIPDWDALATEIAQTQRTTTSSPRSRIVPRTARRFRLFSGFGQELSSSLRSLLNVPAFSLVAILTLAFGVGANTAIFSVIDTVLLKPLPYPEPDRLVRVWERHPEEALERVGVSTGDVVELRRRNEVLEGIGAWYAMGRTLIATEGSAQAQAVQVAQVSADFFSVMGRRPLLGRTFTAEETARAKFNSAASHVGTDPVVVLTHGAWLRRFGGDPSILGRTISLERQSWRVVGVMPPDFSFPGPEIEMWIPWSFQGTKPHDQRYLHAVARLKPGVSVEAAESSLNLIAAALGEELPETNAGWRVRLVPLHADMVGRSRTALVIVFGAVALVLMIACVNIASLQLVRMAERHKEIVLRVALGASRTRLARQCLTESLLLAFVSGALAIPLAYGGLDLIVAFVPEGIPRLNEVVVDARVLSFAGFVTLGAGVFFGLVPAFAGSKAELAATLRESAGRSASGSPRWQWLRRALVSSEIAMAVVLLACAGLLVRSFGHLISVDPGFDPERVVVLPITLDNHEYDSGEKSRAYYRTLMEKLLSLPGVVSVGGVTALPMSPIGPDFDRPIWAEGETPPAGGASRADVRMATPGYFETLGIPVLRGRGITEDDRPDSPRVVVINESLARQAFPGVDPVGPVGRRLVIDYSTAGTYPYEVVGVVNDLKFYGLRTSARPELYLPHAQRSYLIMNIAVRTDGGSDLIASELRKTVLDVDPLQPAHGAIPLADLVAGSVARDRFAMLLLGAFAVLALALALLGIFGVLSYHVGQRTHEVGIRAALGASRGALVAMMLVHGVRLTLVGLAWGLVLSLLSTRLLSSLLFGVSAIDPMTFTCVALLLAAGALAACYLPARRAARVDPVIALRHE